MENGSALHPVQVHHPRPKRYIAAPSIEAAVAALADPANQPARIIAGGTDLLLEIERGVRTGITTLVDISRVASGATVEIRHDGARRIARLGPMVTHSDVVAHPTLVAGALPLAQACWEIGSPQLRNRATVAGNVITASPANDTISALLALGAAVELTSMGGTRNIPVGDFITGFRTTELAADEIVSAIEIPLLTPNERAVFVKLGNRSAQAISVVHVAVVIAFADDGITVVDARLALGSVAPTVVLAPEAAARLIGRQLDDVSITEAGAAAAASVTPIDDVRATAGYRADVIPVAIGRALRAITAGTQSDRWPAGAPRLTNGEHTAAHAESSGAIDDHHVIATRLNGEERAAPNAVGVTLLDWLRDEHGATGTKEGCAEGECGACTVLLDGDAVMSCLVPAARASGADIVTVEGVGADGLHLIQQAFIACTAVQCGFCTPGFIVAAAALLDEIPVPTAEQIQQGLAGNLCRCTGYTSIVEAVERASASSSASDESGAGR